MCNYLAPLLVGSFPKTNDNENKLNAMTSHNMTNVLYQKLYIDILHVNEHVFEYIESV